MISIIGYGHVGKAMHKLFPDAYIYDEPLMIGTKKEAYFADISFICVPTPSEINGNCDTTIVESIIEEIESKIVVIRSTVPVGFTEKMKAKTLKKIIFQPEYYGETVAHPFADLNNRDWLTLGGDKDDVNVVLEAYQKVYNSDIKIIITDSKTAELAKYMENCFLALKVTFCNEFFDIASAYGVNYHELREVWLADSRIGRSHTFVYEDNRGFGGKCLPKDTTGLVKLAEEKNVDVTLMNAVINKNKIYQDSLIENGTSDKGHI